MKKIPDYSNLNNHIIIGLILLTIFIILNEWSVNREITEYSKKQKKKK
jgi:hypothetical protein